MLLIQAALSARPVRRLHGTYPSAIFCKPLYMVSLFHLSCAPHCGSTIQPIYLVSLSDPSVRSLYPISLSCCIVPPYFHASLPILPAEQSCSSTTPLYRPPLRPLSHKDHIRCGPLRKWNPRRLVPQPKPEIRVPHPRSPQSFIINL